MESYSALRAQTIKEQVEWYKQPCVRTTVSVVALATILGLIVFASLNAHALRIPHSALGSVGHRFFGVAGLIAGTTAGFVSSAVLAVSLLIYRRKASFWVSDYIHEYKGFFYKISDEDGNIKGYLYGTEHVLPRKWPGLDSQTQNCISGSRQVILETELKDGDRRIGSALAFGLKGGVGADYLINDSAKTNGIPVAGLATREEHGQMGGRAIGADIAEKIINLFTLRCLTRASLSQKEIFDRLQILWQKGNDESASSEIYFLVKNGYDSLSPIMMKAYDETIRQRNDAWMSTIGNDLAANEEKPVFIAVGCMHLFDFPEINDTKGLITQITDLGYTVERVSEEAEEAA